MRYVDIFKRGWLPDWLVIKSDYLNSKDPDYFKFSGTQIYIGRQGSGKTISAVNDVDKIKKMYPKCKVVTNLDLKFDWADEVITFHDIDELADALVNVNNGKYGVVYLIDEIHTYFNSLDSKNIPPYIFTEISQQRKQRKLIIGTSQLFLRLAKPFREQCDHMINCRTVLGKLTFQTAYDAATVSTDADGGIVAERVKSSFFWHTDYIRNAYDTFQKVVSGAVQFQEYENTEVKKRGRRR